MTIETAEGFIAPLADFVESRSGDSKLIKGKQSQQERPGLFPAFSASGQDIWTEKAQFSGEGIVVSAVGARCGKTFRAHGEWTAVANTHVLRVKHGAPIDNTWLWYLTNNEDFWIKSGTAQPFVKVKLTLERNQWIPPLDEQKRVVAQLEDQLGKLEAVRRGLHSVLEALGAIRDSELSQIGTGKRWGQGVKLRSLGSLGKWKTGKTPPTSDPENWADEVEFVTPGDLGYGNPLGAVARRISQKATQKTPVFFPNSVLLCSIGATLGKVSWTDRPVAANQQINGLEVDADIASAEFLAALMASPTLQSRLWEESSSTTMPIINKRKVEELLVPMPDLASQHEFARELAAIDEQLQAVRERIIDSEQLIDSARSSILHRAFLPPGEGM